MPRRLQCEQSLWKNGKNSTVLIPNITFSSRTDMQEALQMGHQVSSFQFNLMILVLPKTSVSQSAPAEEPNHCNALLSS